MVKLVDTPASGVGGASCAGSSPALGTTFKSDVPDIDLKPALKRGGFFMPAIQLVSAKTRNTNILIPINFHITIAIIDYQISALPKH